MIEKFEKDSKALKKILLKMCWYMRGSISVDEMWNMSFEERNIINDIISENLETTKETRLPFF